jgi:hypothetical protein
MLQKTVQGAEHNSSTEKRKKQTAGSFNIYNLNAWRLPIGAETCSV